MNTDDRLLRALKKDIGDTICINSLSEEDIGRWVMYTSPHGSRQHGRLKSWNDHFVFVVYNVPNMSSDDWERFQEYTAAGSKPEDLVFTSMPAFSTIREIKELIDD